MGKIIHTEVYFHPQRVMKCCANWGTENEDAATCWTGAHID